MYNYEVTRLYLIDEEFSSRWQLFGDDEELFIHKGSLLWINGRTMTIPKVVGDYFFFNDFYWLQVKEHAISLGQRMDE